MSLVASLDTAQAESGPNRSALIPEPCAFSDLPPEIISDVFGLCLSVQVTPAPSEAPLLLGQVCRRWREIALSTPRLWNEIFLFDPHCPSICSLLEVWLSRAHDCPLHISLMWAQHSAVDSPSTAVWDVVTRFSGQLESLGIDLPFHELRQLEFLRGRVPSLKYLTLTAASSRRVPQDPRNSPPFTITIFEQAPKLISFNWKNLTSHTITLGIPWSQLKSLALLGVNEAECLWILKKAVNLTECAWGTLDTIQSPGKLTRIAPMRSLRSLHLRSGSLPVALLPALAVPRLCELTLSIHAPQVPDFRAFLSRTGCRLRYLSLQAEMMGVSPVLQCLHHNAMRTLTHLKLIFGDPLSVSSVLQLLHADETFLPKLEMLTIGDVSPPTQISYEPMLIEMLQRRWRAGYLKAFSLSTRCELVVHDKGNLRALLEEGMLIDLETLRINSGRMERRRLQTLFDTN
ncbi:hypothetical protein B0H11DRAFT_2062728 [Mycena galericulata]|nr:hypothetical protein B0H11DRAFT_2062728 [Mycena galericulata]